MQTTPGRSIRPGGELAWSFSDAAYVLDHIREEKQLLLGVDVLTKDMEHTYDNWYYTPQMLSKNCLNSLALNSLASVHKAQDYIQKYIERNGEDYLLVFVVCDQAEAALFLCKDNS